MGIGSKGEKQEEKTIITDIIHAQEELKAVKEAYGVEEEEKGLYKLMKRYYAHKEAKLQIPLNKKKYILLLVFTGLFGGHRFYAKQYITGVLYLLTFWTGVSFVMSLIDLMVVTPLQADENGMVTLGQKKYVYDREE